MKKKSRLFTTVLLLLLTVVLVGCNNGEGNSKTETYVMEAEYIDLSTVIGAGISSEASGVNMIHGTGEQTDISKGWSSGYYLGFTYSAGLELDFVFNAENAGVATVILRLGSEIGNITFDPSSLEVRLNGTAINYQNMLVYGSNMDEMSFTDITLTTDANLVEGSNTITIEILNNTLRSGQVGGPMIDCIKLVTDSKLTWTDKLDNPSQRGAI